MGSLGPQRRCRLLPRQLRFQVRAQLLYRLQFQLLSFRRQARLHSRRQLCCMASKRARLALDVWAGTRARPRRILAFCHAGQFICFGPKTPNNLVGAAQLAPRT
jgi:hypothetical protein